MKDSPGRVAIVGGGFSGASMAVQLARRATRPLAITVLEPRPALGAGLAYSADDPDHRINAPVDSHVVDPADPDAPRRWYEETRLVERDPEARGPAGGVFPRRREYGAFVAGELARASSRAGITLEHRRERAVALLEDGGTLGVRTSGGAIVEASLVVIATGSGGSRPPAVLRALAGDARFVADALEIAAVRRLPSDARVLLVGSGLTALDVTSTLVRGGHRGPIVALSRHGVRPAPQRPPRPDAGGAALMQRIAGPVPEFVAALGARPTALALSRALRREIRRATDSGGNWYGPFDSVRDVVWQVWPRMGEVEKARFLRHLRAWYDAHRFRTPPQNAALVADAEARGQVVYRVGRLSSAQATAHGIEVCWRKGGTTRRESFDAVVNCAGLDPACGAEADPFLRSLVSRGTLRLHATGLGFDVDASCRPIGRDGVAHERLRVIGPPTAGTWGDPLGTLFIAPQVARIVPGMLALLGDRPAS